MKATSSISEHSAEYYLVPALKKILNSEFEFVAPIFPWFGREFGKTSKLLHKNDRFHVLVMFPRRPKITNASDQEIYVTMNEELNAFKKVGDNNGVPVIAGCPKANNFWDLAKTQDFAWLNISELNSSQYLHPLKAPTANIGLLTEKEIITLVRKSHIFDLTSFEGFVYVAKSQQPNRMFGARYKPVYFLIKT